MSVHQEPRRPPGERGGTARVKVDFGNEEEEESVAVAVGHNAKKVENDEVRAVHREGEGTNTNTSGTIKIAREETQEPNKTPKEEQKPGEGAKKTGKTRSETQEPKE